AAVEARRADQSDRRPGPGEFDETGRAVRLDEEISDRRRPLRTRSAPRPAERCKARLVDARMVVGPTEYPARQGMGCCLPEGKHGWHLPECAHLVRLRRLAFTG